MPRRACVARHLRSRDSRVQTRLQQASTRPARALSARADMSFLRRKKAHSVDDAENMVTTSGVLTALLIAFVVPMLQMEMGTFDRLNLREGLYDWKNDGLRNFVITTLEAENFNFTVDMGAGYVFDAKAVLKDWKHTDNVAKCGGRGSSCTNHQVRDMEMAMELIWPALPQEKLRMYFILHSDEAKLWLNRSTVFYILIPLAVVLLVVSLVGSVMLYLSLAMSSAREDESGEHGVLERWTSYGIPITLGCYFMNSVAMILFLACLTPYLAATDFYIYKAESRSTTYFFAVGVPGTIAMAVASVALYFHAEHAKIPLPCMEKKRDTGATVHVSDGGERFGEM